MDLGWLKTVAEWLQIGVRALAGLVLGALVLIIVGRLLYRLLSWFRGRQ
jgi:hypothetical protein